mgnify:CR=1 FL=1
MNNVNPNTNLNSSKKIRDIPIPNQIHNSRSNISKTASRKSMNNTVKCANGNFIGKETEDLIVWRGIPYATQPIGNLRWKKALPAR